MGREGTAGPGVRGPGTECEATGGEGAPEGTAWRGEGGSQLPGREAVSEGGARSPEGAARGWRPRYRDGRGVPEGAPG